MVHEIRINYMCREDEQKRIVDFSKRYLLRLNYVIVHDLLRCPGTSDHMHPEVGQYRDATTFCECSVEPQGVQHPGLLTDESVRYNRFITTGDDVLQNPVSRGYGPVILDFQAGIVRDLSEMMSFEGAFQEGSTSLPIYASRKRRLAEMQIEMH